VVAAGVASAATGAASTTGAGVGSAFGASSFEQATRAANTNEIILFIPFIVELCQQNLLYLLNLLCLRHIR
jgi:hypothetical protein